MKKLYEVEIQRRNVTPKTFFSACVKAMQKHGASMEDWADYDSWADENQSSYYHEHNHADWDKPQREVCAEGPYNTQRFLARAYNFILEFDFDTDKKGTGYLYAVEFER